MQNQIVPKLILGFQIIEGTIPNSSWLRQAHDLQIHIQSSY